MSNNAETFAFAVQQLRSVQAFLEQLQQAWTDQAARRLRGRFLEPQNEESEQLLKALENHMLLLEQAETKLRIAQEYLQEADHFKDLAEKEWQYAEQEIMRWQDTHAQFLEHEACARTQMKEVFIHIQHAKELEP